MQHFSQCSSIKCLVSLRYVWSFFSFSLFPLWHILHRIKPFPAFSFTVFSLPESALTVGSHLVWHLVHALCPHWIQSLKPRSNVIFFIMLSPIHVMSLKNCHYSLSVRKPSSRYFIFYGLSSFLKTEVLHIAVFLSTFSSTEKTVTALRLVMWKTQHM